MPKSRKSGKKNGKQTDKSENQWVHVEGATPPDSWEIVEDECLHDVEGQKGAKGPRNETVPAEDAGKLSDDDLIVILEDSCPESLDLSLVTGNILQISPKDSPKRESPSTEESPITSHEESPESELDKSSDFQIIDHSEDESSNETDLLLENEILEAAKRNVSLKYSHIVRQSPSCTAELSLQSISDEKTCTGTSVPFVRESMMAEKSLLMDTLEAYQKQSSEQDVKPKTENEDPRSKEPDNVKVSPSSGQTSVSVKTAATSSEDATSRELTQETAEGDHFTGFVEKKSKKQKKREKKRQAAVEATEDVSDQRDDPKDSEDQQITDKASSVHKEYFETFSKNKKQRDLATMSILLAKDQTIEDIQVEDAVANTEDSKGEEPVAGTEKPTSLEMVREVSVPEETESISGGSEETASIAGTEDSSDRLDANGCKETDEQIVPKKVSKSARRRKKLKEKMAKVIENFSNPGLVIEKYEKTFGEDYVPPSKVMDSEVDSSITCPVCLELYYHPYHVEPCGHVFCEPCLRKLTVRSCLDIPCPLCRKIIQSCHLDEDLSHRITKSFPVKSAARNRSERKSKTKKSPLPRVDMEPGTPVSIKDIHPRGGKGQDMEVPFSRITIQRILLVIIAVISYIFTSCTIRAITYFDINGNNSTNYIFMTLIFCLYFYFVDKGVNKLKYLVES